jgi:hypothetical protein
LGHVVGIWVKSPFKPEQKPEQLKGLKGELVSDRLALRFGRGGEITDIEKRGATSWYY